MEHAASLFKNFLFSFSSKKKEEFLNFNAMRGVRMDSCSQAARRENAA
jgi:hypothetical protein